MFSVYVLYSKRFDKIYIGYTSDLVARLESHNKLSLKGYTTKFRPWQVLLTEEYQTKSEAIKRERQLKSAQGRKYVWSLVVQLEDS